MTRKEELQQFLPFWDKLEEKDRELLIQGSYEVTYEKGMLMHRSEQGCAGILLIVKGQLRTYLLSEEGREVTLFRVRDGEVCVLSATCLMDAIVFDVMMDAVEETKVIILPTPLLNPLLKKYPRIEVYLYKSATERFSDVLWTMQQILFMSVDKRVAAFLWDEMLHKKSTSISITHDEIAKLIGSAREVVTKVLKYFVEEGIVTLGRGRVEIVDVDGLKKLL